MSDRGRGRGRGYGRGRGAGRANTRGNAHNRSFRSDHAFPTGDGYGEVNTDLHERFRKGSRSNGRHHFEGVEERGTKIVLNKDIAQYVKEQNAIHQTADSDDWLSLPEIPTPSEVLIDEYASVSLPRNRIEEPWSKPARYLRTHYRLLREDTITSLRESVSKVRKDPRRMDDHETRVYEQVRIVGLTFTFKGIASRIRFSTARSNRRILWSASKRLVAGTLVALTPTQDAFQTTCILATVAARPLENLEGNAPEIDIFFANTDDHEVDVQKTYYMVESHQGYFEAYRHTMKALQKQSKEQFPLAEHVCKLVTEVPPPDYLIQNPTRDITPASDEVTAQEFQSVDLLRSWPAAPSSKLDATQWAAMKDILTKRLAIIQGPPGTGKTHVSKIALEIMLRNRSSSDPPIIVACQTNHALDQLLQLVQEYEPNFIRLGGRSKSPNIKPRALHEVRKGQVYEDIPGSCYRQAQRAQNTQMIKLKSLLTPVWADTSNPLTAEVLDNLGVIGADQRKILDKEAERWVVSDNEKQDSLQMWLGGHVFPFVPVYSKDSFGFEEVEEDLEMEQLKEFEAENGVVDEEDTEMLRGDYLQLSSGYTIHQPSPHDVEMAKQLLDTKSNLYHIPEHLRGAAYMVMQEKALSIVRKRLQDCAKEYSRITDQIQIGRWEKDAHYLSQAPLIGMTTTGLSKYRALVAGLKPQIILIEEAAEVLEAPISVACVPSVQHLILVGDHQQLQPSVSVKELEGEPYFLNISMFERLWRNGLPHKTLLRQRRMEAEFRDLIQPIYPKLQDHESIATRPRTEWGTGKVYSWFYNHDYHELQDESLSTYNEHEAEFIAKFYRYLRQNGVPHQAITVLTFYNGQRKKILRALKNDPYTASEYNIVKTVDSYQGEENVIVLLSLTRNNSSGKIGFLNINNRVVVALSRARFGFYIFGNGQFLAEHNEVWSYVEQRMYVNGRSSDRMPLICQRHNNTVWVKDPVEFDKLNGGCLVPCGSTLNCGHLCPLKCHPLSHESIACMRNCEKELECGHSCSQKCFEPCSCDNGCNEVLDRLDSRQSTDHSADWRKVVNEGLVELESSEPCVSPAEALQGELTKIKPSVISTMLPSQSETPAKAQNQRKLRDGRTRYEEQWQSQRDVAPTRRFEDLKIHDQRLTQIVASMKPKQDSRPVRQPKGPSLSAIDTIEEHKASKPQEMGSNPSVPEISLISWDAVPANGKHVDMSEWMDEAALRELEEMKTYRNDDSMW